MRKIRRLGEQEDNDPLHGVANFFDLGVIFALGFLLALMGLFGNSATSWERRRNPGKKSQNFANRDHSQTGYQT